MSVLQSTATTEDEPVSRPPPVDQSLEDREEGNGYESLQSNSLVQGLVSALPTEITYPATIEIGNEKVKVRDRDEHNEAKRLIKKLSDDYGVTVDSSKGIQAIKDEYPDAPDSIKNQLKTKAWELKELAALDRALGHYARILGSKRADSSRSSVAQEVVSASKIDQAIDEDSDTGVLDDVTMGEHFEDSSNMSLFTAGTDATGDFPGDNAKQLEATITHELSHGIFGSKTSHWVDNLDYWTDEDNASGVDNAEAPPTTYGRENAEEDLCESVMLYFVAPSRMASSPLRKALSMDMSPSGPNNQLVLSVGCTVGIGHGCALYVRPPDWSPTINRNRKPTGAFSDHVH